MPDFLTCDRCDEWFIPHELNSVSGRLICANYYRRYELGTTRETVWAPYFRGFEEIICLDCMKADPEFMGKYPWMVKHAG